ncbi:hypothetical protein BBF96_03545 [Anoxybacter fermentans]|uniref:Fibronectin type-III domain-containing protein n=1 Tax=Anoxybacter fermentans TaxID=1323375 RepID=A0A3S9SW35_9FIRM|nr:LamG-like jellyroll fold domain-containing protein [Anoxybacter fermentans]AZR72537.1 hypothetical protein BBF96_03545 [Anoxybacter fermentans]
MGQRLTIIEDFQQGTLNNVINSAGTLKLVQLTNAFPHSQSFEDCAGEHIGDINNSNAVKTDIGGGWQVATHYNTTTIRVETDGGYHGTKRLAFIHDGSSGWKGAVSGALSVIAGKWYRVSVRARANMKSSQVFSEGYAFYVYGVYSVKFSWNVKPTDNPGKWVTGVAIFQAPDNYTGYMYLYGLTDGENGLILEYDAVMWEEFDADPTNQPFGFTVNTGYPIEGGERISPVVDISAVGIAQKSRCKQTAAIPTDTNIELYSSLDDGKTWQGVVPGWNPLASRIGLKFDGVDDYVYIPSQSYLALTGDEPETVEMRVKPNDKASNYFLFQANTWSRRMAWSGYKFYVLVTDIDGTLHQLVTPNNYAPNNVYHITYTFDENYVLSVYVNGELAVQKTIGKPLKPADSYWWFGSARAGSDTCYFDGTIYEARFWRGIARTQAEIQADMDKHLTGDETGLIGYWTFNTGEGSTVKDRVYRGNYYRADGTIYGAQWDVEKISGYVVGQQLLLKQKLLTDDPSNTPQLQSLETIITPANALVVTDSFKSNCKDFSLRNEHNIDVYNVTKAAYITQYIDLTSLDIRCEETGIFGHSSANTLTFDIELSPTDDISTIIQEGDVIRVEETFNNEQITIFVGYADNPPVEYNNLKHRFRIEAYDYIKRGIQYIFQDHEVKTNWYLCNNDAPDQSLAHYLGTLMGFSYNDMLFEDITDANGNYITIPYAHLERGKNVLAEFSTLVQSVCGKLFVNHDGVLVLTSPFNEEDFYDINVTFDDNILGKIEVKSIPATNDEVRVIYDTFHIAERQVCWMLYDKTSYDEINDKANMLLPAGETSAWIKIQLVTPICLNLEGAAPEIVVEDANGNDMSAYFQYDLELDMTGGKVRFYNLHSTEDLYIQKFKIYGQPLEKLSGNEYIYSEATTPNNPLEIKNKFIQTDSLAEAVAKYTYHMTCKDRKLYKFKTCYAPYLALTNKVKIQKRDINTEAVVTRYTHAVQDNYLVTKVELLEFIPYEGFPGNLTAIQTAPNIKDDKTEFTFSKMENDGIFPEGLPVPQPTGVVGIGSFKHIFIEWNPVDRRDLLGYNIYVDDGNSYKQYFTKATFCSIEAESGVTYNVQVTAVTLAGESTKTTAIQVTTASGVDWSEVVNAAVNTNDIVDRAISTVKIALDAITSDEIANSVVQTAHLINQAVTATKIALLAVQTSHIENLAVDTAKINDLAVTTGKLVDLAVQSAKINDLAVISTKIADLAVATAKIADLAVTNAKIASLAVAETNIQDGSITNAKIANAAVDNAKIANAAVDSAKIANASITSAHIQNLAVQDAHIQDLNGSKIHAKSITAEQIRAGEFLPIAKPEGAHLWHFDRSLISTDGIRPEGTPIATLRLNEGKFGGAVAVEEGTENLLATVGGGAAQDWSKWSHWNSSYWGKTEQYDDEKWGKVFKGTKDGASSSSTYIYDYYPYSYAVGDVLTFSCYMRVNKDITKTIDFYVNSSAGGQHHVATPDSKVITFKAGEWQYITWTSGPVTETVNGTGGFGLAMGSGWEGYVVEIAYPQLEKKPFATSFVNGTRASGDLAYSADIIDVNKTTWHFVWIPEQSLDSMVDQASYPKILSVGEYYKNNSFVLWFYDKYIALYIKGSTAYHWSAAPSWIPPAGWYQPYNKYTFDVQIENGNHFKVYLDGELIIETTITDSFTGVAGNKWWVGDNTTSSAANALFDELMVSNEIHTAEEIKAWCESQAPFFDNESVVSGGSTIIDANGFRAYDGNGLLMIELNSQKGTGFFKGSIEAEEFILPIRSV